MSLWRFIDWLQSFSIFPARIRTEFLRFFGVKIDKSARIAANVFIGASNICMKRNTFINIGSFIDGCAPVTIEEYVRIGPYVKILTGTHKYRNSDIRRWPNDLTICKSVIIKRGCWLGIASIILPGITVAEGCIIAAGAVVTKDTKPHGLYAGVPAVRVKDLSVNEVFNPDHLHD